MKHFRPKIRSRHDSHNGLRGALPLFSFPVLIRLGSHTTVNEAYNLLLNKLAKKGLSLPPVVEINTVEGIRTSSNKLLMKQAFDKAGIRTAEWWVTQEEKSWILEGKGGQTSSEYVPYPIVAKHIFGSRGTGNHLLKNKEELDAFLASGKDLSRYIFEKYYSYNKEYRLHVSKDGCFYTCRKMLKADVAEDKRWFRNDSNSVWVVEDNELFERPVTWNLIVADCVKALAAIGLDFAAFDVRVQSSKRKNKSGEMVDNPEPTWIIIESNSAPSFGDITEKKYKEILPKLIQQKHHIK